MDSLGYQIEHKSIYLPYNLVVIMALASIKGTINRFDLKTQMEDHSLTFSTLASGYLVQHYLIEFRKHLQSK